MRGNMERQLNDYVQDLFHDMPDTRKVHDMKVELLDRMKDQYNHFILIGVAPEEAYGLVIENLGDVNQLLEDVQPSKFIMKKAKYEEKIDHSKVGHILLHVIPWYWGILLAVYLGISLSSGKWAYTWIILVLGGVLKVISKDIDFMKHFYK